MKGKTVKLDIGGKTEASKGESARSSFQAKQFVPVWTNLFEKYLNSQLLKFLPPFWVSNFLADRKSGPEWAAGTGIGPWYGFWSNLFSKSDIFSVTLVSHGVA